MTMPNGDVRIGQTDAWGRTSEVYSSNPQPVELTILDGDEWQQAEINSAHQEMDKYWNHS